MNRKFLSVVLSIFIVIAMFTFVSANGETEKGNVHNMYMDNYVKIINHFKTAYGKESADNYAGAYFDEKGELIINVVDNEKENGINKENIQKVFNTLNTQNVKVKIVEYSLKELDIVALKLKGLMIELDINSIERDDENNKVYIYLNNLNNDSINKVKNIIDVPYVEFRQTKAIATFSNFPCTR